MRLYTIINIVSTEAVLEALLFLARASHQRATTFSMLQLASQNYYYYFYFSLYLKPQMLNVGYVFTIS